MLRHTTSLLLLVALVGCAALPPEDGAYNKGVEAYRAKNYAEARAQWARSIERGELSALNNLGYLMYYGLGGSAEPERAVALWKRGAAAGHSEAQWHLGTAFEEGIGTEQSAAQAYAWYRCAVASAEGTKDAAFREAEEQIAADARKSLSKLIGKLTKDQFERGNQLAAECLQNHAQPSPPKP